MSENHGDKVRLLEIEQKCDCVIKHAEHSSEKRCFAHLIDDNRDWRDELKDESLYIELKTLKTKVKLTTMFVKKSYDSPERRDSVSWGRKKKQDPADSLTTFMPRILWFRNESKFIEPNIEWSILGYDETKK